MKITSQLKSAWSSDNKLFCTHLTMCIYCVSFIVSCEFCPVCWPQQGVLLKSINSTQMILFYTQFYTYSMLFISHHSLLTVKLGHTVAVLLKLGVLLNSIDSTTDIFFKVHIPSYLIWASFSGSVQILHFYKGKQLIWFPFDFL